MKALILITADLVNGTGRLKPGAVVRAQRLIFIPRHLPGVESAQVSVGAGRSAPGTFSGLNYLSY